MKTISMFLATGSLLAARTAAFTVRNNAPRLSRAYSRTAVAMAENPKVFFDMEVGGDSVGRLEFELRADVVPKVRSSNCWIGVKILCLIFWILHSLFRTNPPSLVHRQPRTSERCALVRKATDSKGPPFIESFLR